MHGGDGGETYDQYNGGHSSPEDLLHVTRNAATVATVLIRVAQCLLPSDLERAQAANV